MSGSRVVLRRSIAIAGLVGAGLAGGGVVAVHALASGSPSTPPSPSLALSHPAQARATALNAALAQPHVNATNAHCGQTITASLTLNGDLFCSSGVGLIVGGNSVVLNLNGHLLVNDGTGSIGILVSGSHDTVEKGNVEFWDADGVGVGNVLSEIRPVSNTITGVFARYNEQVGILDGGNTTTISSSTVVDTGIDNGGDGILSIGDGGTYKLDHELNNSEAGLLIEGQHVTVSGNIADGNAHFDEATNTVLGIGILVEATGPATLTGNTANNNGVEGISASFYYNEDGGGNKATGNGWGTHEPGFLTVHPYGAIDVQCEGVVCS